MRTALTSILFLSLAGLVALAGCGGEETSCGDSPPVPEGQFQVKYTYLSGNCTPQPQGHPVRLEPGNHGVSDIQMNRVNDKVQSVVVYKGCAVSVEYRVLTKPDMDEGVPSLPISAMEGDMKVRSADELTGEVTVTEFNPPGTQTCSGQYSATMTKNETTIGAAAD